MAEAGVDISGHTSNHMDEYLDVPFDLSKVMFITTGNILDTIPPALRDRMEVLMLHGYTLDEKVKIANRYLIPRQREAHGIKAKQIKFTGGAVKQIVTGYTREAGLRNLERQIATVLRKIARRNGIPLVATNDCHYLEEDDSFAHDVLLCIQMGMADRP